MKLTKKNKQIVTPSARISLDDLEKMSDADKFEIIKYVYDVAKKSKPDYDAIMAEIAEYDIELPMSDADINFPKIKKLFAIAQSYTTRVSNLEMKTIAAAQIWRQLCDLMNMVITDLRWRLDDLTSKELLVINVDKLKNARLQQAAVRKKLSSYHKKIHNAERSLTRFKSNLSEIEELSKIISIKKKDLASVLMNLNRQLKTLKLELSVSGDLNP